MTFVIFKLNVGFLYIIDWSASYIYIYIVIFNCIFSFLYLLVTVFYFVFDVVVLIHYCVEKANRRIGLGFVSAWLYSVIVQMTWFGGFFGWDEGCYQGWWTYWRPVFGRGQIDSITKMQMPEAIKMSYCGTKTRDSMLTVSSRWRWFKPTIYSKIKASSSPVVWVHTSQVPMALSLAYMMVMGDRRLHATSTIISFNISSVRHLVLAD